MSSVNNFSMEDIMKLPIFYNVSTWSIGERLAKSMITCIKLGRR